MKFLVIGDSCTDRFVYGSCDRLCPEAPVPVLNPTHETKNGGMAKNVQRNIISLGEDCQILTNHNDIIKTRYVDNKTNQILLRVDENDKCDSLNKLELSKLKNYDAIIISDYNKGYLSEDTIKHICETYENVFIDTKKRMGEWINSASFIKINQYEYENNKTYVEQNLNLLSDKLIITYGDKGCYYKGKMYPPHKHVEVKDLSGAGDTFLASFVVQYMKEKKILEAIGFAQKCSSEVVGKKGVATV
jgi:bifunctional ADP-heptose synthase (sugar kinase/adenylyltransferase)